MSRATSWAVLAVIVVALGVAFIALETRRVPDRQVKLDAYLAGPAAAPGTWVIRSWDRASRPWNFYEGMGRIVSDDGVWRGIDRPYPPRDVVCALVERGGNTWSPSRSTQQLLFVAYYDDRLYRHGWVVYRVPGDGLTQAERRNLDAIGCELELRRGPQERDVEERLAWTQKV
jgi:hypothetical protein